MINWQPIDTAHKDQHILAWANTGRISVAHWNFFYREGQELILYPFDEWWGSEYNVIPPTHWAPVPEGPQ